MADKDPDTDPDSDLADPDTGSSDTYTNLSDLSDQADPDLTDPDLADIVAEKSWVIFPQYVNLMNDYLLAFLHTTKFSKSGDDNWYLLINGLNTLSHCFTTILNQTLKPVMAINNTQDAIYYYTHFIEKIEEAVLQDLNVSSNIISIFVYKKCVKEKHLSLKSTVNHEKQRDFLTNITTLIGMHTRWIHLLAALQIDNIVVHLSLFFKELCYKFESEKMFSAVLCNVTTLLNHLENEHLKGKRLYELMYLYIKTYKHNHILSVADLSKKKMHPDYDTMIQKRNLKWLTAP